MKVNVLGTHALPAGVASLGTKVAPSCTGLRSGSRSACSRDLIADLALHARPVYLSELKWVLVLTVLRCGGSASDVTGSSFYCQGVTLWMI